MPVVSSAFAIDGAEVVETHTLSVGGPYVARYFDFPGCDHNAVMLGRVAKINRRLAQGEFVAVVLRDPGPITLNEQTAAQFADRFWGEVREAFQSGDRLRYARLLWWVYEMVVGGWLTSAQVRASFNVAFNKSLDATQWNDLVNTRIVPAHDRYAGLVADTEVW